MIGILSLCLCICLSEGRKIVIAIEKVENCPNIKPLTILEKISITNLGREGTAFNLNLNITVGKIPPKLRATQETSKCTSVEEADCEHFVRTNHDFCRILKDKNQFYSSTFESITPRLLCPAYYRVHNATLSSKEYLSIINFVPNYKNIHWRIAVKILPKKAMMYLSVAFLHLDLGNFVKSSCIL